MNDMVKVRVFVQTNRVGSKCEEVIEFDREDWESMSESERTECCMDVMWNMAEWGFQADED